jgi:nucleoside-diphosphate-sugar epimerase
LAALFANQNSVQHPEKDLMINGLGTLKILEKSKLYGVKKVIYTSSSCVYGNMQEMEEEKPLTGKLDTPYAITKLLGEQYCQFYSDFHKVPTAIIRLFNSYGPGEKPGVYRNVIPNFFYKAMQGESLIITGTGEETRDFTFVTDVIDGLYRACFQKTEAGEVFNLGSGKQTSIQNLVELINKMTGNKSKIIYQPRRNWDHVLHRTANIEKAKNNIGYSPAIDIQEGLQRTFSWLSKNA